MDTQQFLMYLFMIVMAMGWWSNYRLRNKCLVIYTRASKQELKKLVNLGDNYVVFDGQQCEITPNRARLHWYEEGIFGKLFGTWLICYHCNYADYFAENPNKMGEGTDWETPANRNKINSREFMGVMMETSTPEEEKARPSKLKKYLPWIIGIVGLVVGYYVYSYILNQNAQIAAMQAIINAPK